MYRLLGFKSYSNARLFLSRRNLIEGDGLLFNQTSTIVRLPAQQSNPQNFSSSGLSSEMIKLLTKNKKKKRFQKYTELLQVTSSSTKQTTTAIKNLKAKKLTDFIERESPPLVKKAGSSPTEYKKYQVDIHKDDSEFPVVFVGGNVQELTFSREGYHEIIESYNNFREIAEHPDGAAEAVEEELLEVEEEIIPDPLKIKKEPNKKIKNRFKGKYYQTVELEKLSRQKSLAHSLGAYLDCCLQNGMLNRGFMTVLNYRNRVKRAHVLGIKIVDVNLYNVLIHGYAEKENLQKVRELMNILREDEIAPNEQTYANYLECLGRLSVSPKSMEKYRLTSHDELVKLIKKTIEDASAEGIEVNAIVDKSVFLKNQREVVLHAIRLAVPDFEVTYTPPELVYAVDILKPLNQNVRDITFNPMQNLEEAQPGSEIMESKKGFTRLELEKLAREQLDIELKGNVTIKSIQEFPEPTPSVLHCRKKIDELQKNWTDTIIMAFYRDLNTMLNHEASRPKVNQNLLPYLRAIETEDYAKIILREIRSLAEGSETYSPTVVQLYRALGNRVQSSYQMEHKKRNGILQKTGEIYGNFCETLAAGTSSDNPRQCWQRLCYQKSNDGPSMNFIEKSWPVAAQIGVGRFLYNILMRDLKIDINSIRMGKQKTENLTPAFYTLFRNQGRVVKEEVKPHPVLAKLYRGSQQETITFDVDQVPMVCPPQPWTSSRNGGYLLAKSVLLRLPQSAHQQLDRINHTPPCHLYPALDSLNQLASVPWSVNGDMLDVILKVFNAGGDEKLDVPPLPSTLPPPKTPDKSEAELTKTEKFELFRKKMAHRRKQAEMYSLWCDALYRLSLANHFRDRVFWLPQNMDFRGRVYPIPPHLNHLGSDLARSMLVFHQKKKLGVDGFMWLKLHCINLTGLKKRDSIRERLLFAEQVMDDILDSADRPLNGRMWWAKSDEPWQTLSACMEIAKVLRSGDPENYESSYPIHQDGSCNGLQHYAALGRDAAGAFSVNLAPSDVPQDVYSDVASIVEQARLKDEENGVEVARVLRNFVRRKIIKQTVMTTVYGVTRYGARLQIAKQLKALDDFPKEMVWPASSYLTSKTFDALQEMFTSTKEIQDWFTDCARLISAVCGQNVEWVTPLGLPVVQPYNRLQRTPISKLAKLDHNYTIDMFSKPNIMKQKNAFPPNFIHSLDSSHMMLTSLYCEKAGLTFISVHDCFWTHACTVPEMNKICRDQFVALHSQPILEDLSSYLTNKYSFMKKDFQNDGSVNDMAKRKLNRILTMVPDKGDFNLNNVLKSVYFFS